MYSGFDYYHKISPGRGRDDINNCGGYNINDDKIIK